MIKQYCNKCSRQVRDMNELEKEELKNEGSFVCSDCINKEMENEKDTIEFEDLKRHIGHNIVCVSYGMPIVNVAIECETCNEVLLSFDEEIK